jgi:transposase
MLGFPGSVRIFVALDPIDMRKQFNGLWAAVTARLGEDPKSGAVFAFTNRDRSRLKLLFWDGTGVCILSKRLEQGRFSWPMPSGSSRKLSLAPEALSLILSGIDLKKAQPKGWYER